MCVTKLTDDEASIIAHECYAAEPGVVYCYDRSNDIRESVLINIGDTDVHTLKSKIIQRLSTANLTSGSYFYKASTEERRIVIQWNGIMLHVQELLICEYPKNTLVQYMGTHDPPDVLAIIKQLIDVVEYARILLGSDFHYFNRTFVPCMDNKGHIRFFFESKELPRRCDVIESFGSILPPPGCLEQGVAYRDTVTSVDLIYYIMKFYYQYQDPLRAIFHQDNGLNKRMNYRTIGRWVNDITKPPFILTVNANENVEDDEDVSDIRCHSDADDIQTTDSEYSPDASLYSEEWPEELRNGAWALSD